MSSREIPASLAKVAPPRRRLWPEKSDASWPDWERQAASLLLKADSVNRRLPRAALNEKN
jgi:hypothetical protein